MYIYAADQQQQHTNTFICKFLQECVWRLRSPLSGVDFQNFFSCLPQKGKHPNLLLMFSPLNLLLLNINQQTGFSFDFRQSYLHSHLKS